MTRFVLILVFALLAVPSAAMAQAPVSNAYGGNGPDVLGEVEESIPPAIGGEDDAPEGTAGDGDEPAPRESGATPAAATTPGDSLPFTGLDAGLLLIGGVAMLGVGLGVRRLSSAID